MYNLQVTTDTVRLSTNGRAHVIHRYQWYHVDFTGSEVQWSSEVATAYDWTLISRLSRESASNLYRQLSKRAHQNAAKKSFEFWAPLQSKSTLFRRDSLAKTFNGSDSCNRTGWALLSVGPCSWMIHSVFSEFAEQSSKWRQSIGATSSDRTIWH